RGTPNRWTTGITNATCANVSCPLDGGGSKNSGRWLWRAGRARQSVSTKAVQTSRRNARRPQPRGDESRLRLLDAFETQLQSHSLADVSVAEVAQAAGLKRPAFYFYFAGKHEVVTELLTRIFHDDVFTIEGVLAGGGDPRDTVADAMTRTFKSWH